MKIIAVDAELIKELEGPFPEEACGPAHCILVDKEKSSDYVQSSNGWRVGTLTYFFTPPNPLQSGLWSVVEGLEPADIYTCEI